MSYWKIACLCTLIFLAAFLTGSLISYLIEGVANYKEGAISGAIISGLMGWQLHRNGRDKTNG